MPLDIKEIKTIIFDLDDTLFDTYSQLFKPAFTEATSAMIQAGLNATSILDCFNAKFEFLKLNQRQNVFKALVEKFGVSLNSSSLEVEEVGSQIFYNRHITETLYLFPDAESLLNLLVGAGYNLFLVTMGTPSTQQAKVDQLALLKYFKKIFYVDVRTTATKKPAHQEIQKLAGGDPSTFVSIGNRIDVELRDAKELGMQTILVEHGEYVGFTPQIPQEVPDTIIFKVGELKNIFGVS
jgi:FMN phosphatase YigB (HAD superfamily)